VRVVLDTNVLLSGIFFGGPPGKIVEAWRNGKVQLVLTRDILEEYREAGEDLVSCHQSIDLGPLLGLLLVHAEIVIGAPLSEPVCDDPDDDKFLACAIAARVTCIVSGDRHLLKVSGYRGIEIVRPRTFVDQHLGR